MNGHDRPTVDDATWFDLQTRCLEQLRLLLEYLRPVNIADRTPGALHIATLNLIQVLVNSIDHNARKI